MSIEGMGFSHSNLTPPTLIKIIHATQCILHRPTLAGGHNMFLTRLHVVLELPTLDAFSDDVIGQRYIQ